jgi:O-antigen ligase
MLMGISSRFLPAIAVTSWVILILFLLVLTGTLHLEIYFILVLVGVLIIVEMTESPYSRPQYLNYTRIVVAGIVILFGLILANKMLGMLRL